MPYEAFRTNGGPTLYDEFKTAVTADVLEAGFIFATCILAFSLFLMLPGYTGRQIVYQFVKIIIGVFVTSSIFLCNFGQEWEIAHVSNALTQYRAGVNAEIHADVEALIGLRSINITLKAVPNEYQKFPGGVEERINYNERFHWNDQGFLQGRAGFGPFAGLVNREYRDAQRRGLPYPILWIAEYFTLDGEGIRWGRFYRQAGWYAHVMIWLAFPLWILSMILFHLVLHYGAYMSILTGVVLLTANIIYGTLRNPNELIIPINDSAFLYFDWGWCFYMNLVTGLICITVGVVVWILHLFWLDQVSSFFGADVLSDYDEYYLDSKQLQIQIDQNQNVPLILDRKAAKSLKRSSAQVTNDVRLEDVEMRDTTRNEAAQPSATMRRFKKRSGLIGTKFQRSKKHQQQRATGHRNYDHEQEEADMNGHENHATVTDDEMYENTNPARERSSDEQES